MRIDVAGFARGDDAQSHADLLRLCRELDELGYFGIWFNEFHFQMPPSRYPSTLLLSAAIFAQTERLRVGSSVVVTPLHHPLLLAEEIAQLVWQSGGRFDLGIGRGTHPAALAALGITPEETRERFEQSFAVMKKVWHERGGVPSENHWPASTSEVGPLLDEAVSPPVYVAGGTRETLAFAARNGLPLLLSLDPPETSQLATYRELIAQGLGADMLAGSSLSRYVFIADTAAQAMQKLEARLAVIHRRRLAAILAAGKDASGMEAVNLHAFADAKAILGTPDDCVVQLRHLEKTLGIGTIRLVFNGNGAFSSSEVLPEIRLFAREVLPVLRDGAPGE